MVWKRAVSGRDVAGKLEVVQLFDESAWQFQPQYAVRRTRVVKHDGGAREVLQPDTAEVEFPCRTYSAAMIRARLLAEQDQFEMARRAEVKAARAAEKASRAQAKADKAAAKAAEVGQVSRQTAMERLLAMNAGEYFRVEGVPDNNMAMMEGFRELIILDQRSCEFWIDDGQTPFSRLAGGAQPYGCGARKSLQRTGGTWIWLGDDRRLLSMEGRSVSPVSSPYDRVIQRYVSVTDAEAYVMSIDGYPLIR